MKSDIEKVGALNVLQSYQAAEKFGQQLGLIQYSHLLEANGCQQVLLTDYH